MNYKRYIIAILTSIVLMGSVNAQRYIENAIRRPDDNRNKIRLGLRAGFNVSDLTSAQGLDIWNGLKFWDITQQYIGITDTRTKLGFNAGLVAQLKLTNHWFVQSSLIYTTKGYKIQSQEVEVDVNAHYVQLPIELIYKYPVKDFDLLFSAGAFLGVGVTGMTHFTDHYGEGANPRKFHEGLQQPFIDEEAGIYNLIGCDFTVHGANVYWADDDDTFLSDGTYRIDAGLQLGLGVEYKALQFMVNYQFSLTPLYNYDYDFSNRYIAKAEREHANNPNHPNYGLYYKENGEPYRSSFEYFSHETMSSPRHHVLMFTVSFFFDKFKHNLKL